MALRILLADDSMTAQNMGKKILTDAGYEVVTVSNGAAAVKKIAEVTPDIAILDVYMPGYNGLEVCERVKISPATAHTPVLLSVGKMEPFRPEDGMKVKADGVIIKPFEATDLVTVVEKLASRVMPKAAAPLAASAAAASAATSVPAAPAIFESEPAPAPVEFAPPASSAPETAPVLQTFESANDPIAFPDEPHLELTSVAPAGAVDAVTPPEFQATVLNDSADDTTRHVMTDAALLDGYHFGSPVREQGPNISDVLSDEDREFLSMAARPDAVPAKAEEELADVSMAATDSAAQPAAWHAQEEELTADDLALDLEEAIRGGESHSDTLPQADGAPRLPHAADVAPNVSADEMSALDSDPLDEIVPTQDATPTRSIAAPMLAPIGKTSFDELDSIMEHAAAQFDSGTSSASISSAEPSVELSSELESAADILADPLDTEPQQATADPDLIIEEEPVESEPAPTQLRSSDALSGVFDLDTPAPAEPEMQSQPPKVDEADGTEDVFHQSDTAPAQPDSEDTLQHLGNFEYSLDPLDDPSASVPAEEPLPETGALDATPVESESPTREAVLPESAPQRENLCGDGAVPLSESCTELPIGSAEPAYQVDEAEPSAAAVMSSDAPRAFANRVPTESAVAEHATDPAVMHHATDLAVAAVNAEIQSVPDATTTQGPVERVVDRVVDRLRPMLTVMVEEIMKELKK